MPNRYHQNILLSTNVQMNLFGSFYFFFVYIFAMLFMVLCNAQVFSANTATICIGVIIQVLQSLQLWVVILIKHRRCLYIMLSQRVMDYIMPSDIQLDSVIRSINKTEYININIVLSFPFYTRISYIFPLLFNVLINTLYFLSHFFNQSLSFNIYIYVIF